MSIDSLYQYFPNKDAHLVALAERHVDEVAECPRSPALVERLGRFTDVLVAEVAWHLDRTGSGGDDPEVRARLVVAGVDAAVHEVVLAERSGPERVAATDELVAITLLGLTPAR